MNRSDMTNKTYRTYKTFIAAMIAAVFLLPGFSAQAAMIKKQPNNLGLKAYWNFDEGKGIKAGDFSGNGNKGTLSNTTWTNGKHGKALNFNGSNSAMSVASYTNMSPGANNFSIAFWIKTSGYGDLIIGADGNAGTTLQGYGLAIPFGWGCATPGQLYFNFSNGAAREVGFCSSSIINDGGWHHVSITVTRGDKVKFYIDGNLDNSLNTTLNGSVLLHHFSIGQIAWQGWLNGLMDDIRLYNRALSASEALTLYQSGQETIGGNQAGRGTDGLVGYWSLNASDVSGSSATDASGKGRTLTLFNGPAAATGRFGQALSFNGSTQYASTSNAFSEIGVSNQAYTVSAWVKIAQGKTQGDIIHTSSLSNGSGWCLAPLKINGSKIETTSWSSGDVTISGNTTLKADAWYFLAATWSASGGLRAYVNGNLDASTTQNTYTASGVSNYIFLGGHGGGCASDRGYFTGTIDEPRVYSRALSQTELTALYNLGKKTENTSPTSRLNDGLIGYWNFNGANMTDTLALDSSGNGYTATLAGNTAKAIGKIGQGLYFDGSGDYVAVPYTAALAPASAISYGAWFKSSDVSANTRIISKTEFGGFNLGLNDTVSGISATVNTTNGGYHYVNYPSPQNNRWYHAFVTYDGSNVSLYVDGQLASSTPATGLANFTRTNPLCIGSEPNSTACTYGNYLTGLIDEVRIYNRALAPAEVKQLYIMGK